MSKNAKVFAGVVGGLAAIVVIYLLASLIIENGVINTGNKKQQTLIAKYNETTNVLSDCLVKTEQSIGGVNAQTAAVDKVITDAVRGRYTEGSTAQPGSGAALFSALREAYPDTSALSESFQKVLVTINGCRTDFRNAQADLQKYVALFEEWRTGSFFVREFGGDQYPNDKLVIKVEGENVTGEAAIEQMRELVVVSEARTGRDTNEIENSNPFGGESTE